MISPRGVKSIFQVEQVSTFHQQLDMDSCLGSAAKSFIRHEENESKHVNHIDLRFSPSLGRTTGPSSEVRSRPPARPDSHLTKSKN